MPSTPSTPHYSPVASAGLGVIRWQAPVDLAPQYTGNDLLIHYGSPLVTAANTVIVPVKTGATGGFELQALSAANGTARWTLTSDYALMPSAGANGYSWTPSYSPTLTPSNRLYFAGLGGTVLYTDSPDAAGPTPPTTGRLAFFGLSNYNANPSAYNSTVFINTPITTDAAGDIFFGFLVTGSNPLGLTSGVARIDANGTGSFVAVVSGMSQVATNSAPALSNDGSLLYVLESTGNFGSGKLVALNSQTLCPPGAGRSHGPAQHCKSCGHHQRRHRLADRRARWRRLRRRAGEPLRVQPRPRLAAALLRRPEHDEDPRRLRLGRYGVDRPGLDGAFVPRGSSTYLLMTKYNNYAGEGGDGVNKIAILDPNASDGRPGHRRQRDEGGPDDRWSDT